MTESVCDLSSYFHAQVKNGHYIVQNLDDLLASLDTFVAPILNDLKNKIPADISDFSTLIKLSARLISELRGDDFCFSLLAAYHTFGLLKLLPLLLDPEIAEIYAEEGKKVYVDHVKYGRLLTNIFMTNSDMNRLSLICQFFGRATVSVRNPSLKTELITDEFIARISMDFPPLSDKVTLVVRKLSSRISFQHFIRSDEDALMLAVIVLHLALRRNILLIGEPGAGKTTLASLLINVAPHYWRIIMIEDVREAPVIPREGIVKLRVNPIERPIRYSKEIEILKLLHRSPDYVFVGELHEAGDFRAFFHAISSGIKGIATTHASSPAEFLDRITNSIGIPKSRLSNIDLFVFMQKRIRKGGIERRISSLATFRDGKFVPLDLNSTRWKRVSVLGRIMSALKNGSLKELRSVVEEISDVYSDKYSGIL